MSYQIGSLKILQRFEANFFEIDNVEVSDELTDKLVSSFRNVDINNNPSLQVFQNSKLSFIKDGHFHQMQTPVELATKSTRSNFPDLKWNMLFFTNGNRLVIGWHHKGVLEKIENLNYSELCKHSNRSKNSIQESMSKLVNMLERLKDFVMSIDKDGTRYSLVCEKLNKGTGVFNIHKCTEKFECLPKEFVKQLY